MRIDQSVTSISSINTKVQISNENSSPRREVKQPNKAAVADLVKEPLTDLSHKPKSELTTDEQYWIGVIERANKALVGATCNFEFSIHEKTKGIMVKVIDKETKEVIREFPPEKILDMVAKMWEMAGMLVDERR